MLAVACGARCGTNQTKLATYWLATQGCTQVSSGVHYVHMQQLMMRNLIKSEQRASFTGGGGFRGGTSEIWTKALRGMHSLPAAYPSSKMLVMAQHTRVGGYTRACTSKFSRTTGRCEIGKPWAYRYLPCSMATEEAGTWCGGNERHSAQGRAAQ